MELKWHGETCVSVKGKNAQVVINPHKGLKAKLKANLIMAADDKKYDASQIEGLKPMPEENAVPPKVFDWPGEYEASGVSVIAIPHENGLIFRFEVDDVTFCHLDSLTEDLTEKQTELIGDVDVLIVPSSKDSLSGKKAHAIIEEIEPRVVIPMIGPFDEFLKELGKNDATQTDSFKITSRGSLPEDKTDYVILEKS